MRITHLQNVNFGFDVHRTEDGDLQAVVLTFRDARQLVPGTEPVVLEIVAVPFDGQAWENFKRQVAADGEVTPIAIARTVPTG